MPDQLAAIRGELRDFIEQQAPRKPPTALRYAIERMAPAERKRLMSL